MRYERGKHCPTIYVTSANLLILLFLCSSISSFWSHHHHQTNEKIPFLCWIITIVPFVSRNASSTGMLTFSLLPLDRWSDDLTYEDKFDVRFHYQNTNANLWHRMRSIGLESNVNWITDVTNHCESAADNWHTAPTTTVDTYTNMNATYWFLLTFDPTMCWKKSLLIRDKKKLYDLLSWWSVQIRIFNSHLQIVSKSCSYQPFSNGFVH